MAMLRDRNRTIIARLMNNTELRIWRVVPLEYIASIEPKCISFNHRLIVGYTIVIIEDRSTHTTLSTECAIIDRIVWLAHIIVFFLSTARIERTRSLIADRQWSCDRIARYMKRAHINGDEVRPFTDETRIGEEVERPCRWWKTTTWIYHAAVRCGWIWFGALCWMWF